MVIDFQHHYIPVALAKKRGLYSETGRTMLQEGGLPATTMHQGLYDLDLQEYGIWVYIGASSDFDIYQDYLD